MVVIILMVFIFGVIIGVVLDVSIYGKRKIEAERNYWECEAKKWADQLAGLRHNIQSGKCARCKLEDTSKCREC